MATYDVTVRVTFDAVVQVEASSRKEAERMAERGPGAWFTLPSFLPSDHCCTEAVEAWRQTPEPQDEDEMQSWRDREQMHLVKP